MPVAKVYLVGAGPGDPGLITVRGRDLLAAADAVLHDALVNPELLTGVRPDAQVINVGKRGYSSSHGQDEINTLMLDLARSGKTVCRLKGGDPFVFGRGGEEAAFLAAAGVPFEIVPGVTSGIGGPAYAGIPVTHRDANAAVCLVTGHDDPDDPANPHDWSALARIGHLVFYMAVKHVGRIAARLVAAGLRPTTPAAIVERATWPSQRVLVGTAANLGALAERAAVRSPAVIVFGDIVRWRDKLAWFAPTEAQAQADAAVFAGTESDDAVPVAEATAAGAQFGLQTVDDAPADGAAELPLEPPIEPPVDAAAEAALAGLTDSAFVEYAELAAPLPPADEPAPADELAEPAEAPAAEPPPAVSAPPADRPLLGRRVLVTRAAIQASDLTAELRRLGAEVVEAPMIEVVEPSDWGPVDDALRRIPTFDWVVWTSANGVKMTLQRLRALGLDGRHLARCKLAGVGPTTIARLAEHFLQADLWPSASLGEALANALADHAAGQRFLLLRADIARPDLPNALRAAGAAAVEEISVYQTRSVGALPPAVDQALAQRAVHWVTFTSGSTVRQFVALLGRQRLAELAGSFRLASIGPQTSAAARASGLTVEVEANPHSLAALVAAICQAEAAR